MAGFARWVGFTSLVVAVGTLAASMSSAAAQQPATTADTVAIAALARDLSSDANRGRGPWTPENARVAKQLARMLEQAGARPVFGTSVLVPFTTPPHPADTVYNVVGVFPGRNGTTTGDLVGMTAHLDHLGVGPPDATGDSIYNGFLDDAVSIAMIFDVARRYVQSPGDRPLVVMFFNLEEQGLLGAKALAARADAAPFIDRLKLLIGVDAGSPAGEALTWQIMGPGRRAAELRRAHRGLTRARARLDDDRVGAAADQRRVRLRAARRADRVPDSGSEVARIHGRPTRRGAAQVRPLPSAVGSVASGLSVGGDCGVRGLVVGDRGASVTCELTRCRRRRARGAWRCDAGQGDGERRSTVGIFAGNDGAGMSLDDSLCDREAYAEAMRLRRNERRKQRVDDIRRQARPVSRTEISTPACPDRGSYRDATPGRR